MSLRARKHDLLLPFPAFGHILSQIELGRRLSNHHNVTLAVSNNFLLELVRRNEIQLPDITFLGILDEFTWQKEPFTREQFLAWFDLVFQGISNFLAAIPVRTGDKAACGVSQPVDRVIGDIMLAEPLTICAQRGIPYYFFNPMSAQLTLQALACSADHPIIPSSDESTGSGFDEYAAVNGQPPKPMPEWYKRLMLAAHRTMHLVSGVLINSVRELELDTVKEFEKFPVMEPVPVWFLGPLMPDLNFSDENVLNFLNRKPVASVVYLCFRSVGVLSPQQITEIGKALLILKQPFIWSLTASEYMHLPSEISAKISSQFDRDDSEFLVLAGVSQKVVLQHPGISVFVTHGGWNGMLESVACGVPIVVWPAFSDHKINAEWLVKQSAGAMIEGTGAMSTKLVSASELADVVRSVGFSDFYARKTAQALKGKVEQAHALGGNSALAFQELIAFATKDNC